jgi:hypothetical protein
VLSIRLVVTLVRFIGFPPVVVVAPAVLAAAMAQWVDERGPLP